MTDRGSVRPRTLAARAFRALVRLIPADPDGHDVDELCAIYDDLDHAARPHRLGSARTFARELPGLLRLIAAERAKARRKRGLIRDGRRRAAIHDLPYSEDSSMLESLTQDLRYAARALRKSGSFTAIAIATLALGIGANTAIFSVVNGVLLAPLAFHDPGRVVTVMTGQPGQPPSVYSSSPANFIALREQTRAATQIGTFTTATVTVIGPGEPESYQAVFTTGDIFGVLRVRALFGRTLMPADDPSSAPAVAVLSYRTWQRLYGEDRSIVGKAITVNRRSRVIVGVLPPGFEFGAADADLWMPEQWSAEYAMNRDQYYLQVVARVAPGQTIERFSSELETVAAQLRAEHADYNTDLHLSATPLQETVVGSVRPRLFALMGAVAFLLLITCANLANLTLARASSRSGEFAIRRALGAGRSRVIRQLLTESVLLAAAGGLVGLAVGSALLRAIVAAERSNLPRMQEISLDSTALLFTVAVSLVAGVVVGFLPALRASAARSMEVLRQGTRGTSAHEGARRTLVVVQLAIALVLLTGAGLLLRSFSRLLAVDTGFTTERLLTMRLSVTGSTVDDVEQTLERLRAIPGVHGAAVASQLPVTGRGSGAWLNIIARPTPPNETPPAEAYRVVSPEYFATMAIPLVRGRFPTADDRADRASAVVINETLAKKYWPNADPIGKDIVLGAPGNYLMPPSTIVGIVGDTPDAGLSNPPLPVVFMPLRVAPWWRSLTFVVRTSGKPEAVMPVVRRELRTSFPTAAIRDVRTMETVLGESLAPARLSMRLIGAFALVALITAALGVFGVLSFIVAQRTRELGIRMALGAAPHDLRRLVIAYGARLAVAGLVLGLAGSYVLTRLIAAMLFQVEPHDPATFIAVSLILLGIGVLASWLPARRATRIDPIAALRSD